MRTQFLLSSTVIGVLGIASAGTAIAQDVPPVSFADSTAKGQGSLRIRLRLQDDASFQGVANVQVLPNEGYELVGAPGEEKGDFVFPEVTPGKYFIEIGAPGYLTLRLSMIVEPGTRQRTLIVVMKPRPIPKARQAVAERKAPPEELPKTATVAPVGERDFWQAHELEQVVPRVDANIPCPTAAVLEGVGQRTTEFVSTLEKFAATEKIEHYTFDASGKRKGPERRTFSYVVAVTRNSLGTFLIEEFRDGDTDPEQFPGHVATMGLPVINLLFHPVMASDFEFRCEGMGEWNGRRVWQVHFAQRNDRPVRLKSYRLNDNSFGVHIEGRAMIDVGNQEVVHLESELAKPVSEIELTREHVVINYAPVRFASTGQEIWLPQDAELYVERHAKRYYRRHSFSDFRLFNVDTVQSVEAPKGAYILTNLTDQEVLGELTVSAVEGTKLGTSTLRFVLPARGRVIKSVGLGKDIDMPISAVASATFAHNGGADSVKVDVDLGKETSLDVIPGSALTARP